ncbi:MAG: serine dehydratase subunit alpha family protein [Oscillospiraceae bacterium]|nr:serine dehydratase subunit alpha family protein [Oscillospiraceae bacterium]
MLDKKIEKDFLEILGEELVPAMGCTEPIALAYACAKAREVLGAVPEKIVAACSGNIIKNVRCVSIPNSGGMTGIEPACVLGALCGDASREMEVLEAVTPDGIEKCVEFIQKGGCEVEYLESPIPLHFIITVKKGDNRAEIEVRHSHRNIVRIAKNGETLFMTEDFGEATVTADRSALSVENIFAFAEEVDIEKIRSFAEKQVECNMAIAEKGLSGEYGIGIGCEMLEMYPNSVFTKMKAYAAAGSEARMEGCSMPVIITSGSGNQGIASSVPVIVYAREKKIPEEKMFRAMAFSSLLTVYQKEYIGKLSAFCGAVSASCAAGAAITYIEGGSIGQIKDTIDNTMADVPGIICDGAKASCAAKIASALDAALFAHVLAMKGKVYEANTGIIQSDAGKTISCVGYIGKVGMKQTDSEIVKMMIEG